MIDTKCCKIYHVVYGVPRRSFFIHYICTHSIIDHSLAVRHQLNNYHKTCRGIPQQEGKMIKNALSY